MQWIFFPPNFIDSKCTGPSVCTSTRSKPVEAVALTENVSMLQDLAAPLSVTSFAALIISFPGRVVLCQQPVFFPSSDAGWPQSVDKAEVEPVEHQQDHLYDGLQASRPNSQVQEQRGERFEQTMHSMEAVLRQILANQKEVMANQRQLIRNQKYLLSKQKLIPQPASSKDVQEPTRTTIAQQEELKKPAREELQWWESSDLGLPSHLKPSRILISHFRCMQFVWVKKKMI